MSQESDSVSKVQGDQVPSMNALFDAMRDFDGAPEEFLSGLVQLQVQAVNGKGGAILRIPPDGTVEAVAVYPPFPENSTAPVWLAQGAELAGEALKQGAILVRDMHGTEDLYGQGPREHVVMVPLSGGRGSMGVAVFLLGATGQAVLERQVERLELTISLMYLHELRLVLEHRQLDLARMRVSMDTLSAVNAHSRFTGAAMSICSEMAARWQCERVSFGVMEGRYVKLKAMSNTEKFSRKMKLVQDIEAAMEECLDQDIEIVSPASPEATYVSRANTELARKHGPSAVVSIPLRRDGKPVGVVLAERPQDQPLELGQIEAMRLSCELCTARLLDLHDTDRWFGARAASSVKNGLSTFMGPKHTWAKLTAIVVFLIIVFLVFFKGTYSAEGEMTINADKEQQITAPFEGILESVNVKVGDPVVAGKTVLFVFDTEEMNGRLFEAKTAHSSALKEAKYARGKNEIAEAVTKELEAEKIMASIRLLESQISRASVKSVIDGTVASGNLEPHLGRRFGMGEAIMSVARMDTVHAEVLIDEDQIADIELGQKGELATHASPGEHMAFVVERIDPVAEVAENRNVFRVRLRFKDADTRLKLNMSGIAKIHVGKRLYAYIWSRKLVNWLRMKLWM